MSARSARRGLILFAHGARDARWAAPFEAVADRIRRGQPAVEVRLAFLELMRPDLPEAASALVDAGVAHLHIVPMFLGAGGHVRRDLPPLVERLRATHPDASFTLHPPIGEIDAVIDAMAAFAGAVVQATAATALTGPTTE